MTNRQLLQEIVIEAQTLLDLGERHQMAFDLTADEDDLNKAHESLVQFGNRIADETINQAQEFGVL